MLWISRTSSTWLPLSLFLFRSTTSSWCLEARKRPKQNVRAFSPTFLFSWPQFSFGQLKNKDRSFWHYLQTNKLVWRFSGMLFLQVCSKAWIRCSSWFMFRSSPNCGRNSAKDNRHLRSSFHMDCSLPEFRLFGWWFREWLSGRPQKSVRFGWSWAGHS